MDTARRGTFSVRRTRAATERLFAGDMEAVGSVFREAFSGLDPAVLILDVRRLLPEWGGLPFAEFDMPRGTANLYLKVTGGWDGKQVKKFTCEGEWEAVSAGSPDNCNCRVMVRVSIAGIRQGFLAQESIVYRTRREVESMRDGHRLLVDGHVPRDCRGR